MLLAETTCLSETVISIVSPDSDAKKSQSFLCPRAQAITLMLDPPPSTLPILSGMERPFEVWIGLSHKLPIALAPEVCKPASRFCHAWHIVGVACFEQEHANVWILCQVARHHRARRA